MVVTIIAIHEGVDIGTCENLGFDVHALYETMFRANASNTE